MDPAVGNIDGTCYVLSSYHNYIIRLDNIVLRIPVLYGDVEYLGESAVTVLLQALKDKSKEGQISDYEVRRPAHVLDIAKVTRDVLLKKLEVLLPIYLNRY